LPKPDKIVGQIESGLTEVYCLLKSLPLEKDVVGEGDHSPPIHICARWNGGGIATWPRPTVSSNAFAKFFYSYGFKHTTSSPNFPQSNVEAESANVLTAKRHW